jgi:hypothetical protein
MVQQARDTQEPPMSVGLASGTTCDDARALAAKAAAAVEIRYA